MDVVDSKNWQQKIGEFREFADKTNAEFKLERFENGKEMLLVRIFFRPRKEK